MTKKDDVLQALAGFPQKVTLEDGAEVELRPADKGDKAAILSFAKGLDPTDLLFLRVDITKATVVTNWLRNIERGDTVSILAWSKKKVVGYATVDRNSAQWTRRVGEIRVNVAPGLRSLGLGRHLTSKIFDVARRLGLKKLIANMTPDQTGAQAAFARLGFRSEALLADYIEDRNGQMHDLTILSYDIDGLTSQADEPLAV